MMFGLGLRCDIDCASPPAEGDVRPGKRARPAGAAARYSSVSLMTTLSTPSISWSLTPITSLRDVGTFLPT